MRHIAIIGVLDKKGSTNIPMAAAFKKFGYTVLPINYRNIIAAKGQAYFEDFVMHTMKKYRPELTILCKCNGVRSELIDRMNMFTRTWMYMMDVRIPLETDALMLEVLEHAKRTHFSSCTALDQVEFYTKEGARNCFHMIQGIDPNVFKPVDPVDKYKAEISFIGSSTDERKKFHRALLQTGIDAKFYGPGFTEAGGMEIIEDDFAAVCSSSKFMLSLDTYPNAHKGYFSNRLPRYLACGVATLHYNTTGTLDSLFKDGKEIIYVSGTDELIEKVKSIDDATAGRLALEGRNKVLTHYTWEHMMGNMLAVISAAARGKNES